MSYTPATDVPNLNFAQWSQPTGANPRLLTPISATATTVVSTTALLDHTGAAITGMFLMNIKNSAGYTEQVWVPAGSSSDGITFTNVIRGVRLEGLDYTTAGTSLAVAHDADSPIGVNVSPIIEKIVFSALLGVIGSTYKLNARPTYSGTNAIHTDRVFADATARDAAITAPANGDRCYNTATGTFQKYASGAWADDASGTTANASTTVAGKVEIATQAQNDAGTITGETGALLAATPNLNAKSVQDNKWKYAASTTGNDTYVITLAPAPAAYVTGMVIDFLPDTDNTGAATINVNGLGAKTINKVSAGVAATLEDGDIQAGFLYSLAYTGTYFVLQNPTGNTMSTANSNKLTAGATSDASALHKHTFTSCGTNTFNTNGGGTITVTHGLGYSPKQIKFDGFFVSTVGTDWLSMSSGSYSSGTNKCIYNCFNTAVSGYIGYRGIADVALRLGKTYPSDIYWDFTVTAVSSTTFTITVSNASPDGTAYITWSAIT